MAIIPKFFFDAVVAIGLFSNDQDYDWIGTGFLVGKNTVENRADVFLVTSAHIFHQHDAVILRFNNTATNATKDYSLNLFEEDSRAYSVHENADVAAVSISTSKLNDDNSAYSWFSLDDHALTLAQMEKTDVMEGTIVYSLGFPMNLVGNQRKSPICRIGCISRVSDLFQQREKLGNKEFLIDLQAVPGNSGAPVITRPDSIHITGTTHNSKANLVGVIRGSLDYIKNIPNSSLQTSDYEVNSGITLVNPVDVIKEVIEMEIKRTKVIL